MTTIQDILVMLARFPGADCVRMNKETLKELSKSPFQPAGTVFSIIRGVPIIVDDECPVGLAYVCLRSLEEQRERSETHAAKRVLSAEEEAALATYFRVKGDPQAEQAAVLELARLGLVRLG